MTAAPRGISVYGQDLCPTHFTITIPLLVLQETDELTAAIQELGQDFPSLLEPLIYERDRFMVCQLRLLTQK